MIRESRRDEFVVQFGARLVGNPCTDTWTMEEVLNEVLAFADALLAEMEEK
jgi:hypothetical protein